MKLTEIQINEIEKACENIDYGSVTIKLNATAKYVDIVSEKQSRIPNDLPERKRIVVKSLPKSIDKKY